MATYRELRQLAEQIVSISSDVGQAQEKALEKAKELDLEGAKAKQFPEMIQEAFEWKIDDEIQESLDPGVLNAIQHFNQYLSIRLKHKIVLNKKCGYKLVPYTDKELAEHWDGVAEDCY